MKRPLLLISIALVLAVVAGAFAFVSLRGGGPETDATTATVDSPALDAIPGSVIVGSAMSGSENGVSNDVIVTGTSVGDVVITGDTAPSKASKPYDSGSDIYDLGSGEMCPYDKYGDEL